MDEVSTPQDLEVTPEEESVKDIESEKVETVKEDESVKEEEEKVETESEESVKEDESEEKESEESVKEDESEEKESVKEECPPPLMKQDSVSSVTSVGDELDCDYSEHPDFVEFDVKDEDGEVVVCLKKRDESGLRKLHESGALGEIPDMYIHPSTLKFLHDECGVEFTPSLMLWACLNSRLDMVKALRDGGCSWGTATCWRTAGHGVLRVLKYLHAHGCPWDSDTCAAAAENGYLHVLKYAHENGCEFSIWVAVCAARSGDADILRYVTENGCPWDDELMQIELPRGGMEVVRYAQEIGFNWTPKATKEAAGQSVEILGFLHLNECPWDELTCWHASIEGRLDSLKYAHTHGCPWDKTSYQTNHKHIRAYLVKHNCPK